MQNSDIIGFQNTKLMVNDDIQIVTFIIFVDKNIYTIKFINIKIRV